MISSWGSCIHDVWCTQGKCMACKGLVEYCIMHGLPMAHGRQSRLLHGRQGMHGAMDAWSRTYSSAGEESLIRNPLLQALVDQHLQPAPSPAAPEPQPGRTVLPRLHAAQSPWHTGPPCCPVHRLHTHCSDRQCGPVSAPSRSLGSVLLPATQPLEFARHPKHASGAHPRPGVLPTTASSAEPLGPQNLSFRLHS